MKIEEMIAANRADCSGCEACANICPKNAITMTRDAEGFAYPKINPELCIKCGQCDATCPALNFTKKTLTELPPTFVATYQNEKILRHSSSGGMFSALSEIILNSGGVVFGAGFDKNWHVFHTVARNLDELENLRGSKYVQSQIGDVYRQVKEELKSKLVLFSGVSCHCAGLKNFLGKDYENLLTVDVICHGVPSPALWENYIDEISYAHEITDVNFRSKRNGWGQTIDINFADQGHKLSSNSNHLYGRLFLRNLSLRPSCSVCKFRFPNVHSDLTVGDAWGIKDFAPEMFDKRGVSVVFVHTAKGKNFLERTNLKVKQVKFVDAIRKNTLFINPTAADSRREKFFDQLAESDDWLSVMKKYYDQDNEEFRKDTGKRNAASFKKNLQDILSQVRQQFVQNALVVSSVRDKDGQEFLVNFFEQSILKTWGLYFLQPKDDGIFSCTENFSGSKLDLRDTAALNDFVKKCNIRGIFVERPLNFGELSNSIVEWLKACNLPIQFFAPKAN